MSEKPFFNLASTEIHEDIYCANQAEKYDAELATEALMEAYDNYIMLADYDDMGDKAILTIESMGELSTESTQDDIRSQHIQLMLLASELGNEELVSSLKEMTGVLSYEAIVEEKKGFLEKIKSIKDDIGKNLSDNLKQMVTFRQNLNKYNVDKLKTQLDRIKSEELIPKDSVDPKAAAKFNEKLAMMHLYGYEPAKGGKEIATYLESRLNEITKDGIYSHVFRKVVEEFKKFFETKKIDKDDKSSKMIAKLKVDFAIKPESNDFKAGFMTRIFGGSGRLVSVVQPEGQGPKVHVDTLTIDTNKMSLIKSVKKEDGISLLEYSIDAYKEIAKALPILEKSVDNRTDFKMILKSGFSINAGILIKQLTNATVLTAKDLMTYQDIALEYVNLTFENKK